MSRFFAILVLLSGECNARRILDAYCSRTTETCGFLNFGFRMHRKTGTSDCIEICSFVPLVRFNFECGRCTSTPATNPTLTPVTAPTTASPVKESPTKQPVPTLVPTPAVLCSGDRCVYALGYAMHQGEQDTSQCVEICTFNPILRESFACGYCNSGGSLPPTAHPTTLTPTIKPSSSPTATPSLSSRPSMIPTITAMPVDSKGYNVELSIGDDVTAEDSALFLNAISRWESVIVGDLPDVQRNELGKTAPDGCVYPRVIDDLYICATVGTFDGPGNVAGFARPLLYRGTDDDLGLPVTGEITFDSEDLSAVRNAGIFQGLITHEIGHVLGFGLLWKREGTQGTSTTSCPYVGPRATAEFNTISGCTDTTTPVELVDSDPGTRCVHWAENCMADELMTGNLEFGDMPLSRITVASFEDLGYAVDYAAADPFGVDDLNPDCVCRRRGRQLAVAAAAAGESVLLSPTSDVNSNSTSGITILKRRRLSEELYQTAVEFGLSMLLASSDKYASANMVDEEGDDSKKPTTTFVGDRAITVLMRDGDYFFDVLVTRDMARR